VALFISRIGFDACSQLFLARSKSLLRFKKSDLEALGIPPELIKPLYELIGAGLMPYLAEDVKEDWKSSRRDLDVEAVAREFWTVP
jgi:hypothetical protein